MNTFPCTVILAGGGSLMPGMKDAIQNTLGIKVLMPAEPVFSNAIGLEAVAKKHDLTHNK